MSEILMKELPLQDQPYEKLRRGGPTALTDAELLAVIIGSGTKGESALSLCRRVLGLPECKGLADLCRMKSSQLTSLRGIGPVKAMKLACIGELSRRIARESVSGGPRFDDPESVAAYYMEDFRHDDTEKVLLLMLDTRCRLLGEEVISKGTVNMSAVSAREVFLTALRYGAVSVILLHNHPSGSPEPSRADLMATQRIEQAGSLIGIKLLDHIIIGDGTYVSMKSEGIF